MPVELQQAIVTGTPVNREREAWNGRGISGHYESKWGRLAFDSPYELGTIIALEAMAGVSRVSRAEPMSYQFDGRERSYTPDFDVEFANGERWIVEVKSTYVGTRVDRVEKLRAKLAEALRQARAGAFSKVVLITEKNAEEILGVRMPRGTDRKALFRNHAEKIEFTHTRHADRYDHQTKS